MENLIEELKLKIIDRLNLLEIDPKDIKSDDALFNEAQKILNETWETRKELDGPDSWVTVWTRYDLGVAAEGLGDLEGAKTHWQAVLSHAEKAFPPGDTRTVKTQKALNNLAVDDPK